MGAFSLWCRTIDPDDDGKTFLVPVRIPSVEELIKNREPDDDGIFRIEHPYYYPAIVVDFTIEVYGVASRISMTLKDDGVEIVWREARCSPLQPSTGLGKTPRMADHAIFFSALPFPPSFFE